MIFSVAHIGLTAAITAVVAAAAGYWRLRRSGWLDVLVVALLSGAAVLLWRLSANMSQLNDDGLPGFSANDWAAPVVTFVFLTVYADLRPPAGPRRYHQVRVLATVGALVVNVITI
jgi:hypothetical protein